MSPDPQPDATPRRAARSSTRGPATPTSPARSSTCTDDLRNVLERASARETTARVAAGALAQALLRAVGVGGAQPRGAHRRRRRAAGRAAAPGRRSTRVEESPVRCADADAAAAMIAEIDRAKKAGDTVGGVVRGGGARRARRASAPSRSGTAGSTAASPRR